MGGRAIRPTHRVLRHLRLTLEAKSVPRSDPETLLFPRGRLGAGTGRGTRPPAVPRKGFSPPEGCFYFGT